MDRYTACSACGGLGALGPLDPAPSDSYACECSEIDADEKGEDRKNKKIILTCGECDGTNLNEGGTRCWDCTASEYQEEERW